MPNYAIWWLLEAGDEKRFQEKIDELALAFDAPGFVPHITVASRIDELDFCQSFCRHIATSVPAFSSQTLSIHHDNVWNRALYLRAADSPPMKNAHSSCSAQLQRNDDAFYPHLSLLYVEPSDYKPACIDAVGDTLLTPFSIDRIAVFDTTHSVSEWHCVEECRLA